MARARTRTIGTMALAAALGLATCLAATSGESAEVMVYSARAHYGQEPAMEAFTRKTGIQVKSFGGEAGPLFERFGHEPGPEDLGEEPHLIGRKYNIAILLLAQSAGLRPRAASRCLARDCLGNGSGDGNGAAPGGRGGAPSHSPQPADGPHRADQAQTTFLRIMPWPESRSIGVTRRNQCTY